MVSLRESLLLGLGSEKLIFGGIVLCSSAKTVLIRLVVPEAPSEWPTFGFTYSTLAFTEDCREAPEKYRSDEDTLLSEHICNGCRFQRVTNSSTSAMTLHESRLR